MKVFDLFSKRQEDQDGAERTEVYNYEEIPEPLRRQIRKIAQDGLGQPVNDEYSCEENDVYRSLREILCREYGLDFLVKKHFACFEDVMEFMLICPTEKFLDCTELIAKGIDRVTCKFSDHEKEKWKIGDAAELLEEINYRFRRSGLGYQLVEAQIIKVDSQLVHAEMVKPALSLLNRPGFDGPQQEFLDAFRHLKDGKYREAIVGASNAFESTMRAICERKGWTYPANPRATDLIKVIKQNGLFPDYLDKSFDQLAGTLSSGLPQVRNSSAAHGQGAVVIKVPEHIASYALHLAAAKILLLVSAAEANA
ncbi:STM4504/CBY_0614 family protein [Sphingomonas sp.]|uniref:STM4504/CBY_0614 family protein n=1 Tax=Sphingomonas sp. TaxID=28214 RepID=UPI003751C349